MLAIMQHVNGAVNTGSGEVHAMRDVVDTLAILSGMTDRVAWDHSKPDGQDYRAYNLTKLLATGFRPQVDVADGLRRTWEWYVARAGHARE